MSISILKPTLTLSIHVTREIRNLLQAIGHILEVTMSPGGRKNRRWYPSLAQSLSIELWLILSKRWYSFDHFSKILESYLFLYCMCIMIIKQLSSSLEIPLFMSIKRTLRLTIIWDKVLFKVISTPHVASSQ